MNRIQSRQLNILLLSAVCCAVPTVVSAQLSSVESLLRECAAIDHDRQRFACYDQVLRPRKLDQPEVRPDPAEAWESTEPVVPSEAPPTVVVAEEKPVVEDNFGLKEKSSKETVTRTVQIIGTAKNLTGKFLFRTEDDHVWLQTDTRNVRYDEVPFVGEIRTAALGSFFLKSMSSGVSVKVRRIK